MLPPTPWVSQFLPGSRPFLARFLPVKVPNGSRGLARLNFKFTMLKSLRGYEDTEATEATEVTEEATEVTEATEDWRLRRLRRYEAQYLRSHTHDRSRGRRIIQDYICLDMDDI